MKAREILITLSKITIEVKIIIILIFAKILLTRSYHLIHGKTKMRLKINLLVTLSLHAQDGIKSKRSLL